MGEQAEPTESGDSSRISRRALMATATTATLGLAGCSSDTSSQGTGTPQSDDGQSSSTTGETNDGSSGGEAVDSTLNIPHTRAFNPTEANLNYYSESGYGTGWYGLWEDLFWSPTTIEVFGDEVPWIAIEGQNVSDTGCVMEATIRDGLSWHDGSPVTPESLRVKHWIELYQDFGTEASEEKAERNLEVVDDRTYRWKYNSPRNPIFHVWETDLFNINPAWYTPYLERYEDATTQDAIDQVTKDLGAATISFEDFKNEGLGSGMWVPEKWDEIQMTWSKYRDHPFADQTNIEKVVWEMVPDQTKRLEHYKRDDFDVVNFGDLGNVDASASENLELLNKFGFNSTVDLRFNYRNTHMGRQGVRRAIAYLLDLKQLAKGLEGSGVPAIPPNHQTGMPTSSAESWLGKEWMSDLISYGLDSQPEKAKQAMESAGYSKDGDAWVDSDGNRTTNLRFPAIKGATKMEVCGQYVSSVLNEFGIKNDLVFHNFGSHIETLKDTQEFDFILFWEFADAGRGYPPRAYVLPWGAPAQLDYFFDLIDDSYSPPQSNGCETVEYEAPPLKADKGPYYGHPARPKFPATVGAEKINGDAQTLYPIKWRWDADQAQSDDEISEIGKKFAWWTNWDLPRIVLYNESAKIIGDTANFTWKEDSPLKLSHRPSLQACWGRVTGKSK